MTTRLQIIALLTLLLASDGLAQAAGTAPFALANVHFEQNATDGDVEVVFEVKGGDAGLAKLHVVAPDGRTVIDFTAPDASTLGIRQFRCESPERRDVASIKSAYPEGVYTFSAATADGGTFHGQSTLSHTLPATASVIEPGAEAEDVLSKDLEITWTPINNLTHYIIELEQEALNMRFTATLPGSVSKFAVPNGFLLPGKEYTLSIGTVAEGGNISFVETTFTTAE